MHSDARRDSPIDVGLLSPVTVGRDALVSDAAVLDALVTAEVALTRAWAAVGAAPAAAAGAVSEVFGWRGPLALCERHGLDAAQLAAAAVGGGNPVIPLVGMLKQRVPEDARPWIHRGATSQDILDTALALIAHRAAATVEEHLGHTASALSRFAIAHRDVAAAARTLTQHAVPTTVGARAAGWYRAVERANHRLALARAALTPQLAGAAGTLAAFAEELGEDGALALRDAFAVELGLDRVAWAEGLNLGAADEPWHVTRWPITELGDALVQATDALGKLAGDVATLARTEIGELADLRHAQEPGYGTSSAMPQKSNPVEAVLIRSAALRTPHLAATLHTASALAVDERPDGAWHAEWPTLRELLRVALGAAAHARTLVEGLQVDADAVARNLGLTRGLIVSERLGIVLRPLIGRERFAALIAAASAGEDLATLVRALPEAEGIDVDDLLDPARYTGLAGRIVDRSVTPPGFDEEDE